MSRKGEIYSDYNLHKNNGNEILFKKSEWVPESCIQTKEESGILINPTLRESFARVMKLHTPVNDSCIVSVCTKTRPYQKSFKWSKIIRHGLDIKNDLIVLSDGGIIPRPFWHSYPYLTYTYTSHTPDDFLYSFTTFRRLLLFFRKHRYKKIVFFIRYTSRAREVCIKAGDVLLKKGLIEEYAILPTEAAYERDKIDKKGAGSIANECRTNSFNQLLHECEIKETGLLF